MRGPSAGGADRPRFMIRAQSLKRKHQRLILLVLALVALLGAVLLAMAALRNQASYFYVPSDIAGSGRRSPRGAARRHGASRARSSASPTG